MKILISVTLRLIYPVLLGFIILAFHGSVNLVIGQSDENTDKDSLMLKYNIEASGIFQSGRLSQVFIPVGGMAVIGNNKFELEVPVKYVFHKVNGFVLENDIIARAVIKAFPNNRIHPVIGYIYEFSQLYHLKYRHAPGVGFGLHLIENDKNPLILHVFGSWDQTEFENVAGYETFRVNGILFGNHPFVKGRINLEYRLFYFKSLDNGTNFMYRVQPKLLINITKQISFILNLDYRYENIVDPMNSEENVFFSAGVRFSGGNIKPGNN